MVHKKPRIASLKPIVLPDNRRVTLEMVVEGLPAATVNLFFAMPDTFNAPPSPPTKPPTDAPSPYPNLELNLLNRHRQPVTRSLFIVEHKEKFSALTLHLPALDPQEPLTARAEMTYQDEVIDLVEIPFTLHPAA